MWYYKELPLSAQSNFCRKKVKRFSFMLCVASIHCIIESIIMYKFCMNSFED